MKRRTLITCGSLLLGAWALARQRERFLASGNAEKPVVGVDRYTLVGPYKVHYVEAGDGPPLVLIPGSFCTYQEWNRLMPLLANEYRLIAVDYIGVGQSDKPTAGFDYSVQAQAEVIIGLLDAIGLEKVNVMGVSLGGSIALYLGVHWAERVNKVVSIEGFTNVQGVRLPWVDQLAALLRYPLFGDLFIFLIQTGVLEGVRQLIIRCQERVNTTDDAREQIGRMVRDSSRSATRWGWSGIANARNSSTQRLESEANIHRLNVPTLHLVGTASNFKQAMQPTLRELSQLPNVRVASIEDGAHDMQIQKPELVAQMAREFLGEG